MTDRGTDRKKNVILEDLDRIEIEREAERGNLTLFDLFLRRRSTQHELWRQLFSFARPYVRRIVFALVLTMVAASLMGVKFFLLRDGLESVLQPTAVERKADEEKIRGDSGEAGQTVLDEILAPVTDVADGLKAEVFSWLEEGNVAVNTLVWIIVVFLVVVLFEQTLKYFSSVMIRSAGHKIVMDIRNDLFARVIAFSLRFHNKNHSGKLISRITGDIGVFGGFFTNTATDLVQNAVTFVVCIVYVFCIAGSEFFLYALLVFVLFLPVQIIGRKVRTADRSIRKTTAVIYSRLSEALAGQKVIKAFGTEGEEHEKFKHAGRITYRRTMKSARLRSRTAPLLEVLGALIIALLVWFGGTAVIEHNRSVAAADSRFLAADKSLAEDRSNLAEFKRYTKAMDEAEKVGWSFDFLAMLCLIITQLVKTTRVIAKANNNVNSALASADRIAAMLYSDPEIDDAPGAVPLTRFERSIDFRNVHFAYEPDVPVLSDIDLSVKKGSVIALVGPSGSGKTTFVDLIPRFYDTTEGSIAIDGRDLREYTVSSLRQRIGIVSQETFLFSDTVGNNIAYGSEDASKERIVEAAKAANAHDFIMEFDDGYDAEIGERGVLLSGGQRQRIAIARALLKDPPILILDEATSALDSKSEALVQDALFRLMKGRTTFVIAHRLSTIRKADTILVFDETKLAERGSHDELIARGGLYARLHELQTKWPDAKGKPPGPGFVPGG